MNIWFMIWVFVAVILMGTFFWNMRILMWQKMAWKDFAKKHNMDFSSKGVVASGVISGAFQGFYLTVSSDPQIDEDFRGRRFVTVVQVDLKSSMPTEGVVGSPGLRRFVGDLPLAEEFVPHESSGWNPQALIKAQSAEALNSYFTKERTQALNSLMSVKGVNVLFVFNEKSTLLRFETPDPMDDAAKLDRLVGKILEAAKILTV
ncbi:MAG TPA: hypothetical protein PKI93_01820 [Alphaproteobacteria bacterium]|nr:hypothetical protein [Alphaproteobacteria bacterium]HNS45454.1 hypothetical protein [Alphaproteobacteria bacterium]